MKPDAAFQLSTYLSLALATASLGYMVRLHLPGIWLLYVAVVVLMGLAYFVRNRWIMPRWLANFSALVIASLWIGWFGVEMRLANPRSALGLDMMPWIMPRIGPLMAVLMLVKLYRPKTIRDYWLLHGLGLTEVALACVLDRDAVFGVLLLSYFVATVWSIKSFYVHRETVAAEAVNLVSAAKGYHVGGSRGADGYGFRRAAAWTAICLTIALALFFLVPRRGQNMLLAEAQLGETGFNSSGMDLNGFGPIDISNDLVMRVEVRDVEGEAVQLGPEQRWRGLTCSHYRNGRWTPYPAHANDERQVDFPRLPSPQGDQLHVTFTVDMTKNRRGKRWLDIDENGRDYSSPFGALVFLAEPAVYDRNDLPYVQVRDSRVQNFTYRRQEKALYSPVTFRTGRLRYSQLSRLATANPNPWSEPIEWWATEAAEISRPCTELLTAVAGMAQPLNLWGIVAPIHHGTYPTSVYDLADARHSYRKELTRFNEDDEQEDIAGKTETLLKAAGLLNATDRQKALFLEQHLAASGEYAYSLERTRRDRQLSRTADFLLEVKHGHCELFASALALMLRTQGIPARVVTGFRGTDWNPYWKIHEIRQYHAHAWVEALITPDIPPGQVPYRRWLTLDPTPADGIYAERAQEEEHWFKDEIEFLMYLWEFFIMDYGEEQWSLVAMELPALTWLPGREVLKQLIPTGDGSQTAVIALVLAALAAAVGSVMLRRRKRRKKDRQALRTPVAFYRRALQLLEELSLRPRPDQTPREFGVEAERMLRSNGPGTVAVAGIPGSIVAALYQVRYGGNELSGEQQEAVVRDLDQLAAVVRSMKRTG